jgi:hypothetical protein
MMQCSYLPRRAALIAACIGASAAIGVTPALGVTKVAGTNIFGSGSSAQNVAQNGAPVSNYAGLQAIWHANPTTDQPTLNNDPSSAYFKSQSGAGLNEFGNNTGVLDRTQDTTANGAGTLDGFVGTDSPPTTTQLANANAASGGTDEVTVPLLQAPVAILLSLPHALTLGNPSGTTPGTINLTNLQLQQLFDGSASSVTPLDNVPAASQAATGTPTSLTYNPAISYAAGTWGALLLETGHKFLFHPNQATQPTLTATQFSDATYAASYNSTTHTGTADPTTITMEVRNTKNQFTAVCDGGSGTTYNTQGFLSLSGDTNYTNYAENGPWASNLAVNDGNNVGGTCSSSTVNIGNGQGTNTGGSTLVKNTLANPGTAGYAVIADAATAVTGNAYTSKTQVTTFGGSASHEFLFAGIQDNWNGIPWNPTSPPPGSHKPTFVIPGTVNPNVTPITITSNSYTGNLLNESGTYSLADNTAAGVGDWNVPATPTGSWFPTIPGDPNIVNHGGGAKYPIDLGTYIEAWADYDAPSNLQGGTGYNSAGNSTAVGNTVKSLLAFEVKAAGGQASLSASKSGYTKLPTGIDTIAIANVNSINP